MKKSILKYVVFIPVFFFASDAYSQYCTLKIDTENGTIDGIKPSAEWADCKSKLGCYDEWQTELPPEYIDYKLKSYIGVTWNLTKDYFIIVEDDFTATTMPYFGKSKKEIIEIFGKPAEIKKQKEYDREMLFYEKPYGTFGVIIDEEVVETFMISESNPFDSYILLTIVLTY